MSPRQGEIQVRGLHFLSARHMLQLRGVQPLPSRQAEKQLRGLHPLPSREGEISTARTAPPALTGR